MSKALNEVYELQQTIKNAGFAWDARVTSMSLLSPEDRRLRCGAIFGPNEPTREERERVSQSHIEKKEFSDLAVRQMDWRNVNGACFVTPITQQGQCGSCVAFGVVATLEAHCRIAKNYPTTGSNAYRLPRLSEADLFFCGGGQLCTQGWQLCKAFDYAKSTGIVDAGCFPYSDHNQPCNRCATADRQKTKLSDYRWVTDVNEMRTLLIEHGPLTTCFFVYDDFYNYGGGVYKRTSNQFSAHHCVACIGFDDDRQAWICKNSWGPLWGDSGYFMIGYGQCGIDFVMGIPTGFSSIFELPEFYLGPPEKCGQGTNFAGSLNSSGAAVASYRNDKWPTLQYISGKLQASSVTWNQQIEYGLGYMPSMALNNSGSVVEVNKSSMNYDLHCRVGKLKANGTIEFNGSKKFAEGQLPRIALNDDNACVLCFRAADLPSSASAVVGVINHRKQIDWGISEVIATPDDAASIALEGDILLEMHSEGSTLHYALGRIDRANKKIVWGKRTFFGVGRQPSVCIYNGFAYKVFLSPSDNSMFFSVGMIYADIDAIRWTMQQQLPDVGVSPHLTVSSTGQLALFYESDTGSNLFCRVGSIKV